MTRGFLCFPSPDQTVASFSSLLSLSSFLTACISGWFESTQFNLPTLSHPIFASILQGRHLILCPLQTAQLAKRRPACLLLGLCLCFSTYTSFTPRRSSPLIKSTPRTTTRAEAFKHHLRITYPLIYHVSCPPHSAPHPFRLPAAALKPLEPQDDLPPDHSRTVSAADLKPTLVPDGVGYRPYFLSFCHRHLFSVPILQRSLQPLLAAQLIFSFLIAGVLEPFAVAADVTGYFAVVLLFP
jgi:hypothetical protein